MNENQRVGKLYPVHRLRNYGAGVLIILILSLGLAMLVYNLNLFPFSLVYLIAWILLPLGVFTCLYAFVAGSDVFYYLVWGMVMVLGGLLVVTSPFIVPMVLIGLFMIILAIIGIIAYWRKRKNGTKKLYPEDP